MIIPEPICSGIHPHSGDALADSIYIPLQNLEGTCEKTMQAKRQQAMGAGILGALAGISGTKNFLAFPSIH